MAGHKGDPFAKNTQHDVAPDGDPKPPHALLAHDRPRRAGPRGDAAHQEARQRRDHGYDLHRRAARRGAPRRSTWTARRRRRSTTRRWRRGPARRSTSSSPSRRTTARTRCAPFCTRCRRRASGPPERVKKLLRKACKEGDPEANNPAQGVSALMLAARGNAGRRAAAARAQGGHRRAHAQGRHRAVDCGGGGYEELATNFLNRAPTRTRSSRAAAAGRARGRR